MGSEFAEAAEERDGVAKHGVVGAGMLYGGVQFVLDARDGLEKQLAEVAEGVGGLVRDTFFSQSGKDFAEDVVYVGDGVELAGKGGELGSQLFGFETLLLCAGMVDAERGMAFLAKHAASAAVGGLVETLVGVGIVVVRIHWRPQEKIRLLPRRGRDRSTRRTPRHKKEGTQCSLPRGIAHCKRHAEWTIMIGGVWTRCMLAI